MLNAVRIESEALLVSLKEAETTRECNRDR
jgi:hypothetical protein